MTKINSRFFIRLLAYGVLAIFGIAAPAIAGQSLKLAGSGTATFADPNRAKTLDVRVEFQLHDFATPEAHSNILTLNGVGLHFAYTTSGAINAYVVRDTVDGGSPCAFQLAGRSNVLIRIQRDYSELIWHCEMWNVDGSGYYYASRRINVANEWIYDGGDIRETGNMASFGFLRVDNNLVPLGSRQPVTADTGDVTELRFDGNGNDSSGNGHNIAVNGFTFAETPDQLVFASFATPNAPNWAPFLPLRAGHPSTIDGTRSFSMADGSSSISCFWQQVPHADYEDVTSRVIFDDRTSCTPTVSGLVFGPYRFRLVATDSAGQQASADFDIGAVAHDENGVVIYPDERLNVMLGPTLVLGANPWEWADRQEVEMNQYKWGFYEINGGPWYMQHEKPVSNGVALTGTAYATQAGNRIYGVGTNFKAAFGCAGDNEPVTGTQGIVIHVPRAGGGPPVNNTVTINSCVSDTEVVVGYFNYPTIASPGHPWGVNWGCTPHCGNWNNDGINYYDNALAHYTLYYRTGWIKARDAARWLADRWYRSPSFSLPATYGYTPRRAALQSAWIYSQIDTGAPLVWTYDPLPALRDMTDTAVSNLDAATNVGDQRETAYRLSFVATQAYLDPDSEIRTARKGKLVNYYANLFGPLQQPEGHYMSATPFEGDTSRVLLVTNGSATVTKHSGPDFGANYCGTQVASPGSISIAVDDVTVSGTGTSFSGHAGKFVYLRGTLNGQPWSQVSQIASVTSGTSMTLTHPWRGDDGSIIDYQIASTGVFHGASASHYTVFYGQTNSSGVWGGRPVDTDNWYWCRVNSATQITLDKPYTGDTSTNQYRQAWARNVVGEGVLPYTMGIMGWAFHLAAAALDGYDATAASDYRASAVKLADWVFDYGRNPATNGMRYAVYYSNCQSQNFPRAFDCWTDDPSSERSYNIEMFNLFSRSYLSSASPELRTKGDVLYQATYAFPGFLAVAASDRGFADAVKTETYRLSESLTNKNTGQAWGMGGGQTWPAARLGGPAAVIERSVTLGIDLAAVPNAVSARVRVIRPNGAVSEVECSSASACSATVDARQGAHWLEIEYLSSEAATLARSEPQLVHVQ